MILVCTRGHILDSKYPSHAINYQRAFDKGDGVRCPIPMSYTATTNSIYCRRKMVEVKGESYRTCCGHEIYKIGKYYLAVDEIGMSVLDASKDDQQLCEMLYHDYCHGE